jgi:hydrogenase/urease accessory protein HupE
VNLHSTQVLALIVVSLWATASAKGAKGRLLALLFIVAFMAGGFALGFVISASEAAAIRDNTAISLMILLGAISAIGCIFRNRRRSNQKWPFTGE